MIHAFLMIGQSNMSGRGYLRDAKEINTEHIYIQRNGRWQQMFRPVVPDRSFAGVCLAESFAERYAAEHGCNVGLIPCSDGGTSSADTFAASRAGNPASWSRSKRPRLNAKRSCSDLLIMMPCFSSYSTFFSFPSYSPLAGGGSSLGSSGTT